MTDKQKTLVEKICDVLDYDFEDFMHMSVQEASTWNSDNMEDYRYYRGVKEYE